MSHPADSIAPGLLLAMPQLMDPNFRRSVILLTTHGAEGAMGFVINRRLAAPVTEILEGLDIEWSGAADEGAWIGGPVSPESGWVLFEDGAAPDEDSAEIMPRVKLTASIDALRRLARRPPARFRLLLGYAGWGAGQLEQEIVDGSWLLVPASQKLIFDTPADQMWEAAYRLLGIDPSMVVPGGGVQ